MTKIPPPLRVTVDTREEIELKFPKILRWSVDPLDPVYRRIVIVSQALSAGDYAVTGYEKLTATERKWSMVEIGHNLFGPPKERLRFRKALDRLAKVTHPYLFLDMRWSDVFPAEHPSTRRQPVQQSRRAESGPGCTPTTAVLDTLFQELNNRGIQLIGPLAARTPASRIYAGEFILRKMLSHVTDLQCTSNSLKRKPVIRA